MFGTVEDSSMEQFKVEREQEKFFKHLKKAKQFKT